MPVSPRRANDPDNRYRFKGLEGDFSGLAMACFLYVAMQRMAPGTDIGFDLDVQRPKLREQKWLDCFTVLPSVIAFLSSFAKRCLTLAPNMNLPAFAHVVAGAG